MTILKPKEPRGFPYFPPDSRDPELTVKSSKSAIKAAFANQFWHKSGTGSSGHLIVSKGHYGLQMPFRGLHEPKALDNLQSWKRLLLEFLLAHLEMARD